MSPDSNSVWTHFCLSCINCFSLVNFA